MRLSLMLALVAMMGVPAGATDELHDLLTEAWEYALDQYPLMASNIGDDRGAGRFAAVDEAAVARRAQTMRGFLERAEALDRDSLEIRDRINLDVFLRDLQDQLAEIEYRSFLIPISNREGFHINLARMPDQARLEDLDDFESYLARLEAIPAYVDAHIALMRRGLEEGHTLPAVVLDGFDQTISAHVVDDPTESRFWLPFNRLPASISAADQERLRAAGEKAVRDHVVPAYRTFLTFFVDEYLPSCRDTIAASDLPDGRAFYEHRVRHFTTLDVSAEEVHRIGIAEVARIREEMLAVIDRTGFEGDFAAFLKLLRTNPKFYAESANDLLREAAWISKRMDGELPRLFTRLPRTPYGVRQIPSFIAPKTTGAYYGPPAGDGSRAGTYFVNTYKVESRPLYTLEALSLHEAVPGHHLQIALHMEMDDLPPFRRYGYIVAYGEGWALYSERLGLEVGFYEDPYSDFGRLTYEMWRAVRLVVDTGMHALGWDRQRAIDYMATHTALSIHEITTEIDRYIAWPGQALGYKMGELEIRKLRARAEEAMGNDFDIRAFHDEVLGYGPVPLDVLGEIIDRWIARQARGGEASEVGSMAKQGT
ncbi:MAG: DUF885 domain-containing protein [Acidobacteriota bacterium]